VKNKYVDICNPYVLEILKDDCSVHCIEYAEGYFLEAREMDLSISLRSYIVCVNVTGGLLEEALLFEDGNFIKRAISS